MFEEDFHELPLDKCFFITEKKRHARIDELMARKGLSRGQPHLMFALRTNNGCTQKELAQTLVVRPPSVTAALQRLETNGLIKRETDQSDLRVMRVFLTDDGWGLLKECEQVFAQMEKDCFGHFTEEEKAEFRRLLQKIVCQLNALGESADD